MKEQYIFLTSDRKATHKFLTEKSGLEPDSPTEVAGLRLDGTSGVEDLSVEVDEIDPEMVGRRIAEVARKARLHAVAPVVPMKLIAPVSFQSTALPVHEGIAWGVKAVGANTSPLSGNGIVVAVLDTGIDAQHPAFAGAQLVEKDFTGEGAGDTDGHGTHCAGTIFGKNIDGTRIGIAQGLKKALIGKVLGRKGGASDRIAAAILWAVENGANVVSMSLGIDFPGLVKELLEANWPPELATSRALEGYRANLKLFETLAAFIRAQGAFPQAAVIIAAAGNESRRDHDPNFKIAVSPPAVAEGIISVSALGQGSTGLTVAPFSNTGAKVSGPGVGILSARAGAGGLLALSGTSMATPHVAGVAALWAEWLANRGTLTAEALTVRLTSSGETTSLEPGYDPHDVGFGLVRAPQSAN